MDKEDRYAAEADNLVRLAYCAISEAEWRYSIADRGALKRQCDAFATVISAAWPALDFDTGSLRELAAEAGR